MKNILNLLCLIALFSFAKVAVAEPDTNALNNWLQNTKTMQANFEQKVTDNKQKIVQKSYGKIALQRPGKFRWDVQKPMPQLIVANQNKLWIYDKDLAQVTIRSLNKVSIDTPVLLLSDVNQSLDQNYQVRELNKESYELIPKNRNGNFAKIRLDFQQQKIKQMFLTDHLGHHTQIQFSGVKLNENLPENLFVFRAPAGVDVIDETKKH